MKIESERFSEHALVASLGGQCLSLSLCSTQRVDRMNSLLLSLVRACERALIDGIHLEQTNIYVGTRAAK